MSVKFAPGPHPTSVSRQNSANLFLKPTPSSNSPITFTSTRAGDRSHVGPKSPYPAHLISTASPVPSPTSEAFARDGNAERQPLIAREREHSRTRVPWRMLLAILVVIFLGIMVGLGGWRLGKGAGGGRWPGSPG